MSPPRASDLSSIKNFPDDTNRMNPNDPNRIKILRDFKWIKKVWKDMVAAYNQATVKWKSGTGGGPGAAENFANWKERDEEVFADYAPGVGSRDDLAWMYMVDKSVGYPFNVVNEPAPASTVTEDGSVGIKRGHNKAFNEANSIGLALGDHMKMVGDMVGDMVDKMYKPETHPEQSACEGIIGKKMKDKLAIGKEMKEVFAYVRDLQAMIKDLKTEATETTSRKSKKRLGIRIGIIQKSIDIAYTNLESLEKVNASVERRGEARVGDIGVSSDDSSSSDDSDDDAASKLSEDLLVEKGARQRTSHA